MWGWVMNAEGKSAMLACVCEDMVGGRPTTSSRVVMMTDNEINTMRGRIEKEGKRTIFLT